MFDQLFSDVFTGTTVNPASMFGAIGVALVLGLILAKVYQYKTIYSKSSVRHRAALRNCWRFSLR